MNRKEKHTIEYWFTAIIGTGFLVLFITCLHKKWKEMPIEKRISFKKGCIRDFKIACILTFIITIILIMTDKL